MINFFHNTREGDYEIWHDADGTEKDGLCIGAGKTPFDALADACKALQEAMNELQKLGNSHVKASFPDLRKCYPLVIYFDSDKERTKAESELAAYKNLKTQKL